MKIETLGIFQLTLQGIAADSLDDSGKANITRANIRYKPSADLKTKLRKIEYKRIR